jgi:hypothetical protein
MKTLRQHVVMCLEIDERLPQQVAVPRKAARHASDGDPDVIEFPVRREPVMFGHAGSDLCKPVRKQAPPRQERFVESPSEDLERNPGIAIPGPGQDMVVKNVERNAGETSRAALKQLPGFADNRMAVGKGIDFSVKAYLPRDIRVIGFDGVRFCEVSEQGSHHRVVALLGEINMGKIIHERENGARPASMLRVIGRQSLEVARDGCNSRYRVANDRNAAC